MSLADVRDLQGYHGLQNVYGTAPRDPTDGLHFHLIRGCRDCMADDQRNHLVQSGLDKCQDHGKNEFHISKRFMRNRKHYGSIR